MLTVAKWLALITGIGLALLALLYLITDARRHEIDRTNRHTHIRYGCRIECCEPDCPRDEE